MRTIIGLFIGALCGLALMWASGCTQGEGNVVELFIDQGHKLEQIETKGAVKVHVYRERNGQYYEIDQRELEE